MMDHAILVYECPITYRHYEPRSDLREKLNKDFQVFCRLESSGSIEPRVVYLTSQGADDAGREVEKRSADCLVVSISYSDLLAGKLDPRWGGAESKAEVVNNLRRIIGDAVTKYHAGGVIKMEQPALMGEKPPEFEIRAEDADRLMQAMRATGSKDTNPKDAVGVRKWRQFTTVSQLVLAEVGVGMLEGARKYGRHNYRVAGVRASVYVDAAMGHMMQWWEGEDIDADSGLSHITKAICSLFVLRDAMIQDMLTDDRPPKGNLEKVRADLQAAIDSIFRRHPNPVAAYTEVGQSTEK